MAYSVIQVTGLYKTFTVKSQDVPVLKNVDLTINEGDFIIFFGQSGCGKSTLLHIILGLEFPSAGQALLYGKDFYSFSEDDRARMRKKSIGMIYQQPNWIKSLTVIENVAFVASLQGIEKQQALKAAQNALETVGMGSWAEYRPTELSSGQQQKVALARALISDPKIIVADEPTGNLDYRSGIELMNIFKRLNGMGKTIVMVSHNIENVEYSTRVVHMFDGRIHNSFTTAETDSKTIKKLLTEPITTVDSISKRPPAVNTIKKNTGVRSVRELMINPLHILRSLIGIGRMFKSAFGTLLQLLRFVGLLFVYIVGESTKHIPFVKKISQSLVALAVAALEKKTPDSIRRVDLIDIAIKNMLIKKTRTVITIGGMAIGIGAIVFLVSVGYGLEKLVISRVARLEEMRHIEAIPVVSNNVKITDKHIAQFNDITGVTKVLPVIGVVGKVDYNNAATDIAVYGAIPDYLTESAIQPVAGRIFESDLGKKYVRRNDKYSPISIVAPSTASDTASLSDNAQYLAQQDATDPAKLVEKEIQNLKQVAANIKTTVVDIESMASREIIVNRALLDVLSLNPQEAIGKSINLSFIATSNNSNERIESLSLSYVIVGATSESRTPIAYVHINDIQQMGVQNYSQVKLIAQEQTNVPKIRKQLEVLGFKTSSVMDTVSQIENLFSSLRLMLAIVGVVALSVAALGMFNTLTVSLLERTHEVGMMKAIGMMSGEVKELFLSESLVMGVFGGVTGLALGFFMGKMVSLLLSTYALVKGAGTIDITYIPFSFAMIIISLSVIVGFVTGIYPANRATKISALDALRYE